MTPLALAPPFLLALLGGTHCLAMCGGFNAVAASRPDGKSWPPILAYTTGRLGCYLALGTLLGYAGGAGGLSGPLPTALRAAAPWVAMAALVFTAAHLLGWIRSLPLPFPPPLRRALASSLRRGDLPGRMVFGALTGFLPCGLLHAALALALGTGTATGGFLVLLAFGLGTLPSLLPIAVFSQKVMQWRAHPRFRAAAAGMLILAGGGDLWMRWPAPSQASASTPDPTAACPLHPQGMPSSSASPPKE